MENTQGTHQDVTQNEIYVCQNCGDYSEKSEYDDDCDPCCRDMQKSCIVRGLRYNSYVNLYSTYRAYGGPEEGGWWYDRLEPISTVVVPSTATLVDGDLRLVVDDDMLKRVTDIFSLSFHLGEKSSYRVLVETCPMHEFPRPRYE